MRHSRWKYRPSPAAVARIGGIIVLGAAALYLIVSRSTQWDRFFELALGFTIAVYVAAVAGGRLRSTVMTVASLLLCLAAAEYFALLRLAPAIRHQHTRLFGGAAQPRLGAAACRGVPP